MTQKLLFLGNFTLTFLWKKNNCSRFYYNDMIGWVINICDHETNKNSTSSKMSIESYLWNGHIFGFFLVSDQPIK